MSTIDQIIAQLDAAGHPRLPDGHPVADGKPHRYGPKKKHWYSLHEIVRGGQVVGYTGAFGEWGGDDNGAQKFVWQGGALPPDVLAETRRRQEATERAEEEKRRNAAKLAANRARQQWGEAAEEGTSAYLERKQITAEGVRFAEDGTLFVPLLRYTVDDVRMVGLQKITPDGAKRFNKGTEKKGAECRLGTLSGDDKIVMVAEGYATGRSIRMATDEAIPLSVCIDAGNIMSAARALRDAYPDVHILICADDDWKVEQQMRGWLADKLGYRGDLVVGADPVAIEHRGVVHHVSAEVAQINGGVPFLELRIVTESRPEQIKRFENTGRARAEEAAAAVGDASVTFPVFSNREDRKLTDFNDLHCEEGIHVVKEQIAHAILVALAPAVGDVKPFPHLHAVERGVDPMFDQAVAAVREARRASVSLVQRQLKIGYNRAARLLEDMEKAGIVSEENDKGSRRVLGAGDELPPSSAGAADDEPPIGEERQPRSWYADLRRTNSGALLPTVDNIFAILSNDPKWDGVLGFELFALRIVKLKPPPFPGGEVGEWTDRDDARCALWLGQRYAVSPRADLIADAVFLVAERNSYHEVRDYLAGLTWDGTPRLRNWLVTYLGAEDTEYVQLAGFKWLVASVGRVMKPGCKMDNVLILEGAQDAGKSSAFRTIFSQRWFTDANIIIGDKDSYAVMAGKWVIELAELDALSKSESSNSKRFFSTAVDTYRPPYAKRAIDVPRQSVFAGTVNFDTYLKDESGNRRYWPVKVADVLNLKGLAADRDQIWAEAYQTYCEWDAANMEADSVLPAPWQVLPEEKPLFRVEQDARYEGDVFEPMIARFIELRDKVTMEEILGECLKLDISKWTPAEQRRIGKAIKSIGWVRKRESKGARGWYYERPEEAEIVARPASAVLAAAEVGDESCF
ncbi:virulence protein E [Burkholderia pseudomallei]|uniref:VapE domain-containing protein n=1 Tax=Burkholderia pseudomallei TaxID=28450 RepID=UPI0011079187|nr:VapE domain-containing protein [Burkholderia pseudomallei]QCU53082.1 virulence protein E [Burkholderia pseudomallei]QTB80409.1 virulence protein E [Burkholderia pseudomallei]